MKRKFMLYLLLVILASALLIAAVIGGYARHTMNSVLENQKEDLVRQTRSSMLIFNRLLLDIEKKMNRDADRSLLAISGELAPAARRTALTPGELRALADRHGVSEIYLIDRQGRVFNTSFMPDMNFNLFTVGASLTAFLNSVYGRGELFHQRMGISNKTGNVNMYAYYSPRGSDYIVEISLRLKDYLAAKYSPEYYDLLFKDLFTMTVRDNRYLKDLELYRMTDVAAWSFINEGQRFTGDRALLEQARDGREVRVRRGDEVTVYTLLAMDDMDVDFAKGLFLATTYDFSAISRFERESILYVLLFTALIIGFTFLLSSRLFNAHFIRPVMAINAGLKRITAGDYGATLAVAGRDELAGIAANITELRDSIVARERALRESEEKYRQLVATANDAIFIADAETGTILDANRQAEALLGRPVAEIIGRSQGELHPPEEAERYRGIFAAHIAGGKGLATDAFVRHASGRRVPVEISANTIAVGGKQFIQGVFRDITERRRAEQQRTEMNEKLLQANAELRTIDELKSNLLSNVSHELRTPLVAVRGYIEMIIEGTSGPLSARQAAQLAVALRNVDRLTVLIEGLLDFAKLELGRNKINLETFDMRDLAGESIALLHATARARDVVIREIMPAGPLPVSADRFMLERVMVNLLDNALKFTPSGGEITMRMEKVAGQAARVSVTDTGIGIPEKELDRVFDRFYQVDPSATRRFGGLGIGLAICREIIRLHQGEIRADSTAGAGATFVFTLPLAAAAGGVTAPAGGESAAAAPPAVPLRVLVVDDEPEILDFLATALAAHGIAALPALGGRQALALLQGEKVGAVLLDIAMQEMDGLEVAGRIRSEPRTRDLPIVFATARTEPAVRELAYAAGAAGLVTKPFCISELVAELRRVVQP